MPTPDVEPIVSVPSHWLIFTEEPSYPVYPMDEVKICPMVQMDEKTDVPLEQSTTKKPPKEVNENPIFQPFDSIKAKLTASTTYDESVNVSTTYIGAVKEENNGSFQTELQFPFDAQSFTSGSLSNGKEFKILIDTGVTHSYLSKSFYDTNPYLHKFPKIKLKASRIFVGNGEWVPALFIIPMCFSIENHAFEVYVAGPEWWLRHIGYQWPYSDPCSSDVPLGGDPNTQYALNCGNQCPARLLIVVLLYFLRVLHHKYAAAVMVLSPEVLFNIRLDLNAFRLCSKLKRHHYTAGTNTYGTKDEHY